jgi:hypothetical protein
MFPSMRDEAIVTLDPSLTHRPALLDQQGMDHPIAPPRMPLGQPGHPDHQLALEVRRRRHIPVRGSVLPDQPTGPPLTDLELAPKVRHGVPATSQAQKFPRLKSRSIEMSNACSATIRFSREFSCSSAFSRCASSSFSAPYFVRHR